MIANAAADIWDAEGVHPVPKYEDDLKPFRFPSPSGRFCDGDFLYNYDKEEMLHCVSSLRIPWHEEKCDNNFSFITIFIGYQWDIPNKLVSLPDPKQKKIYNHV